jgi:glucose-1-phosphatase
MASPGCVLCDFGNVLAFFDHSKAARQLAALARPRIEAQRVFDRVFSTPLEERYDSGQMSTADFIGSLRAELGLQATDEEIARAWNDIYAPNEAMFEVMAALESTGVRLLLASNTNELHHGWFRPLFAKTLDLFDEEVLSFRVGCRKPDRRFYDACLDAAGVPMSECLYIDDREDLLAAADAIGIRGFRYRPGAEAVIRDCFRE